MENKIEKKRRIERERYWQNKEKRLKQVQEYRHKNRKLIKAKAIEKYNTNKEYRESQKEYQRKHRLKNKKKMKEYNKQYRRKNKLSLNHNQRLREYSLLASNPRGSHTLKEWVELKNKYNNICLCCREKKELTRDHIVPVTLGGSNNINNIQPLCRRCNSKKKRNIINFRDIEPNQVEP